jgi:hypothetical protein
MPVELVTPADVPEIEPLCRRAFDQMGYGNPPRCYEYSAEHITRVIIRGCQDPNHICTKYVRDGVIQGFMAVGLTDFSWYAVNQRSCYEIVWHGDPLLPPARQIKVQMALLRDMLQRTGDVTINSISIDSRYPEIGRLISRLGFTETNRTFIRRSPWA